MASPIGVTPHDQELAPFLDWMREHSILCPACKVVDLPGTGRSVVALRDVQQGDVVVEVPDAMTLLPESSRIGEQLEAAGMVNASGDPQAEGLGLVLALMAERAAGAQSK